MKQLLRSIGIFAALAVMLFSGCQLVSIYRDYSHSREAYDRTARLFSQTVPATRPSIPEAAATSESSPTGGTVPETTPPECAPLTVDFDALAQTSGYIVGWIYCPDTPIHYPIVQSGNNSDFLRAMPDGSYSYSGSIFLDYRCPGDFTGLNSILYGHNLLDETMFGTLEKYEEQSYYDAHPAMYLLTPEADYRVDLIAGLSLDARSELYRTDHTPESFRAFLETVSAESDFQSSLSLEDVTRTLTLSTCAYDYSDARYILVGALTPLDRPEP